MKRVVMASGLALASSFAMGQWAQEPTEVFGIKLGQPVEMSGLKKCPAYSRDAGYGTELCISEYSRGANLSLINLPLREAGARGSIKLFGGVVASVMLSMDHKDYARMRELLVTRYGQPTVVKTDRLVSGAGAVVSGETASWVGSKNTLTLMERVGTINESAAAFSNNEAFNAQESARRESIAKDASKF